MVDEFRSGLVPLLRSVGHRPPEDYYVEDSEELNFLGACSWEHTRQGQEATTNQSICVIPVSFGGFNYDTLVFKNLRLLHTRQPSTNGSHHTLFSTRSKAWIEIDVETYDRVLQGLRIPSHFALLFNTLGFGEGTMTAASIEDLHTIFPFAFFNVCTNSQVADGAAVAILVHATGRVVTVGITTYFALRLSDGSRSLAQIIELVAESIGEDPANTRRRVVREFSELARHMLLSLTDRAIA